MASTHGTTPALTATDPDPVSSSPSTTTTEQSNIPANVPTNPDSTQPSTTTSSDHESTTEERRSRSLTRPKYMSRKSSRTMLIPSDSPDVELKEEENYPPGDARAMSPRRSPEETNAMFDKSRLALTNHAMEVQSSLDALVNRCENVQLDLSKLEKNNNDLQEYIGGLTRSMSKSTDLSSTGRKK
ncbi:hypothetical protein HO133_009124 [Letharia lupina]|uniref:Uncharacterized protein n=1 Tax=Letharia lupina TaxID=560253 RepID=A0A8H6CMM1_9LECA|nr:uncharacterized protein HO133_009124 [Letharia lupina]KAF6226258.1 hypothetical protein HO133_009124 [Letharia lupina]